MLILTRAPGNAYKKGGLVLMRHVLICPDVHFAFCHLCLLSVQVMFQQFGRSGSFPQLILLKLTASEGSSIGYFQKPMCFKLHR
jgi:hypothetical protein